MPLPLIMSPERTTYDHKPVVDVGQNVDHAYQQSRDDLYGLPQTTQVSEKDLKPNTPNIYTVPLEIAHTWIKKERTAPLHLVVTKADVGGAGGHVETADEVQATGLDHILRYNQLDNNPIFRSVFASHCGDDLAFTGVVEEPIMEKRQALDELLWDAFEKAGDVALEQGNYGPKQDLKTDAFTGNIHGSGPASIKLPLPQRENPEQASQTVLVCYADKTEPGSYNYLTTKAWLNPEYNTGLLIASSAMKRGFAFEFMDVDTKAQAIDAGVSPINQQEMDTKMEELGKKERFLRLYGPEDYYDIATLAMQSSRYVISRVFSRNEDGEADQLGVIVSADRLHNIKTEQGFAYAGKDDPVLAALCQGDWPAPGEITSPLSKTPLVAGACRGGHYLHWYPIPINSPTTYFSGPIISALAISINLHSGRIGAITDQLALGTPWDGARDNAERKMLDFREAQGFMQPGTLPAAEQEYHAGYQERVNRLSSRFQTRDAK